MPDRRLSEASGRRYHDWMEKQTSACDAADDLLRFVDSRRFATILADPPWQFTNRTGKVAPEHRRLNRYGTMTLDVSAAARSTGSALMSSSEVGS